MPKDEGLTQARPRIAYRHQAYLKRICCESLALCANAQVVHNVGIVRNVGSS
jgi:hypothetical protein